LAFKVKFTHRARQDTREAVVYLRRRSSPSAQKWLLELRKLKDSLAVFPSRFTRIPTELERNNYRVALHYSHKVIFYIDDESHTVHIVRVYHSARKPLEFDEVE